jgi:hypothetical protein
MARPWKRTLLRLWRPFRVVAGFALLGVAIWAVAGKSSELSGFNSFLSQPHWGWLGLAAISETVSFLAMASLQRALLRAGDVRARLARVTLITFASNAIQSALPLGAGFAALYQFGQYQVLGADEVLSGWVVVATAVVLFVALASLAGVGLGLAASTGSAFDLGEAIIGVIVVAVLAGVIWNRRAQISNLLVRAVAAGERLIKRPEGQLSRPLAQVLERMKSVAPTKAEWARALGWGATVWLADCGCWMFAFPAVGSGIPWQGILLAYCAGQLAATLPITPGGLGVVEGTLTVALVYFVPGASTAKTVGAVLLYRVISFWIPLPAGAACWGVLLRVKRRKTLRELEAGEPGDEDEAKDAGGGTSVGPGTDGLNSGAPSSPALGAEPGLVAAERGLVGTEPRGDGPGARGAGHTVAARGRGGSDETEDEALDGDG